MPVSKNTCFINFLESLEKEILEKLVKGNIFLLCSISKEIKNIFEKASIKIAIQNKKDNKFSNQEVEGLSYKLKSFNTWCLVSELCLIDCKLGDSESHVIASMLRDNSTLHTLNLRGNKIGADGAQAIAMTLHVNNNLLILNLSRNNIENAGVLAIANMLTVNNTLEKLYIGINNIGANDINMQAIAVRAIAQALHENRKLNTLSLLICRTYYDGAKEIASMLRVNNRLLNLNLECNDLGTDGAKIIAEALCVNTSLKNLNIACNFIKRAQTIASMLNVNSTLTTLNLECNHNLLNDDREAILKSWCKFNRGGDLKI